MKTEISRYTADVTASVPNDTNPGMIEVAYANLNNAEPKNHFTVGIEDDVTNLSLPYVPGVAMEPGRHYKVQVLGVGDPTVF